MAQLNVNPTRMELSRLKKKLAAAVRGHKLLRDKRDGMMKQFLEIVRENKELRKRTEQKLREANQYMSVAGAVMKKEVLMSALLMPKQRVELEIGTKNVMGVDIPTFKAETKVHNSADIYSYGYAFTGFDLDRAVEKYAAAIPDMLRLSESEKAVQLLAAEIEKTRRRVNALEYVLIPNCRDTIKYIAVKLDENERSNTTRLMKIKDMMAAEELEKRRLQR